MVYRYDDPADREVAAFIASALALGRVGGILGACTAALGALGARPAETLRHCEAANLRDRCDGFLYRFFTADHLANFFAAVGSLLREFGSLERAFLSGHVADAETTLPAAEGFLARFHARTEGPIAILLPLPGRGGSLKRLHLFLRWMVRSDCIDPGGWGGVRPAQLIVPLDTHMHRLARELGLTVRRSCDARTALEITAAFRRIDPADPVRFDFSLTRLGIHPDLRYESLLGTATDDLSDGGSIEGGLSAAPPEPEGR
ncbi:MAG: TIGR02757 family protein [Spirochaetaceae bacterium]|nr:MAG: TIGR02757 family protein [Spirochaetaceae bacterium]